MPETENLFYKFTVVYCEDNDSNHQLKTVTGLTFGKSFNEICDKLTDYFGKDVFDEMKIEYVSECDILEEYELTDLFKTEKDK